MEFGKFIWQDGSFVEDPYIPFWCQWLQYGMGAFEGIPVCITSRGPAIFKLQGHVERLLYSASTLGMDVKYDATQLATAIINTVRQNCLQTNGYVRPCIGHVDKRLGLVTTGGETSCIFGVMEGSPLENKKNLLVELAGMIRPHPASLPMGAKLAGSYVNPAIPKNESYECGFDDAIMLDHLGNVAEATTANLFLVNPVGVTITPKSDSILPGITRDTIMQICRSLHLEIEEKVVTLEDLVQAKEVFMCGSAAEIKSIIEINFPEVNLNRLIKFDILDETYVSQVVPSDEISIKQVESELADNKEANDKLVAPRIAAYYQLITHGLVDKYLSWLTFVEHYDYP